MKKKFYWCIYFYTISMWIRYYIYFKSKDNTLKTSNTTTPISNKDENSTTKSTEENIIEEPSKTSSKIENATTNEIANTTTTTIKNNTTKNSTSSKKTSTSKKSTTITTTSTKANRTTTKSYVGIPDPNSFTYSIHQGKIDFKVVGNNQDEVRTKCLTKAKEIAFKDTEDIQNTNCIDVMDSENTILGYYLYIKCRSGNCNKYKD